MSLDTVRERSSARVAALEIWFGRVDPLPLAGGITNQNFAVEDRGRRYVVRVGSDIPVHGVVRANELAASRAAHLAGLSPAWCTQSRAFSCSISSRGAPSRAEDVRNPANLERLIDHGAAVPPRHSAISARARRDVLGVPCRARLRAHAARRRQPAHSYPARSSCARRARLEAAVGPIDVVFGHNDLLAANFIDDGHRLWLLDWEYAGFNSPLFDLGGLASNSELTPEQAEQALSLYFGKPVDDDLRRRAAAMTAASLLRETMWSMVSEIALDRRFRLRRLHGREPETLRGGLCGLSSDGPLVSELPSSAKIVIVGGGIVGCSVAYHLGKMGLTDVLLVERGKLTCGSTWHAAGLVGQLRTSANITQLLGYSVELYDRLEKETGLATGGSGTAACGSPAIRSAGPR